MTWEKDDSVNFTDVFVLQNIDGEDIEDVDGDTLYIIGDAEPFLPNRNC